MSDQASVGVGQSSGKDMFLISSDSGGETDAAILVIIFSRPSTAFVLEYMHNREGLITQSSSSKLLPLVFLLPLVYYLRKHLSLSISD